MTILCAVPGCPGIADDHGVCRAHCDCANCTPTVEVVTYQLVWCSDGETEWYWCPICGRIDDARAHGPEHRAYRSLPG